MTLNQLASRIACIEGKKSQARIGDIREILGILADIMRDVDDEAFDELARAFKDAGVKRAKRKKK